MWLPLITSLSFFYDSNHPDVLAWPPSTIPADSTLTNAQPPTETTQYGQHLATLHSFSSGPNQANHQAGQLS